jgi:hypothetical protein
VTLAAGLLTSWAATRTDMSKAIRVA